MNGKMMAFIVISLVAGIGVGHGLGYTIYQLGISQLESEVSNLQSDVIALTTNYTNLNAAYNELEANYSLLIETMEIRFVTIESDDMQPTLKIGDVVVVTDFGLEAPYNEINVGRNGTIIAFWGDPMGKPGEILVRRVIAKDHSYGVWVFRTHGDNNPFLPSFIEYCPASFLIGRVVAIIPESSD